MSSEPETIQLAGNAFPAASPAAAPPRARAPTRPRPANPCRGAPTTPIDLEGQPASPEPEPEQLEPFEPSIDFSQLPPAPPSEEEQLERRQLIRKLMRYRELFPAEVADLDLRELGARPLQSLRDLAADVEHLVATRRSAKAVRGFFLAGLAVLECSGPALSLELHGLTAAASNSRDLLETCDEAAVKYERVLEIDPLKRLALGVAQLAFVVDARNRAVGTMYTPPAPPRGGADLEGGPTPARGGAPITPVHLEGGPQPRPDNVVPREEFKDL